MAKLRLLYLLILIGTFSCDNRKMETIDHLIDETGKEFAPDKRTAIFNIQVTGNPTTLVGETNLVDAKNELLNRINSAGITIEDHITILPDTSIGDKNHALINVSVANLRSNPKYSAELVTQALLGTPVSILKKSGGWYLIQTPDQYIAWTNGGSLTLLDQQAYSDWKNADKLIFLPTVGYSVDEQGNKVSDLVAGCVLTGTEYIQNHWLVNYPDGREALIKKNEAAPISKWLGTIIISDSTITSTAKNLMGVPYLWGGTSTKGVDCSGFTKTVYFLNGILLPRDASQQVHSGVLIDDQKDFSKLEVGDLLFFGRKNDDGSERVIHVGLWLGNNQFIHSSGDVHISSMDSLSEDFDQYNFDRYLRTKRIINLDISLKNEVAGIYN